MSKNRCDWCRFWVGWKDGVTALCVNPKSKFYKTTPLYDSWCKNWSKERRKGMK